MKWRASRPVVAKFPPQHRRQDAEANTVPDGRKCIRARSHLWFVDDGILVFFQKSDVSFTQAFAHRIEKCSF
jgi:hypothetical protein